MRDLLILLIHLITTVAGIASPGGIRSVVAESVLVKHAFPPLAALQLEIEEHTHGLPLVGGDKNW
jgi:hypothetical protein